MRSSAIFWLCSCVIALAMLFGGGTHRGYLFDVALQFISIPLLVATISPVFESKGDREKNARLTLALCLAAALLTFFQVIPYPANLVPPRIAAFLPLEPNAAQQMWNRISVSPSASWAALASVIVPLAIFGSAVQLRSRERASLFFPVLGAGAFSLMLGFLQVGEGPDSPLRFYQHTNPDEAVGFFANRNHFAALLYVTLILAAVWFTKAADASLANGDYSDISLIWLAVAASFLFAVFAGLILARSRAGLLLGIVATLGSGLLFYKFYNSGFRRRPAKQRLVGQACLIAIVLAFVFTFHSGSTSILARLAGSENVDLRVALNRTSFEAALKALPFGTGLGSFVPVYATVEKTEDAFNGYANRAHNDFVEILLETGYPGGILVFAFLFWFGRRSYTIWRRPFSDTVTAESLSEHAATLIVFLLLAHSLVDYPLRTTALASIFALSCALLVSPCSGSLVPKPTTREGRHRSLRMKRSGMA